MEDHQKIKTKQKTKKILKTILKKKHPKKTSNNTGADGMTFDLSSTTTSYQNGRTFGNYSLTITTGSTTIYDTEDHQKIKTKQKTKKILKTILKKKHPTKTNKKNYA